MVLESMAILRVTCFKNSVVVVVVVVVGLYKGLSNV